MLIRAYRPRRKRSLKPVVIELHYPNPIGNAGYDLQPYPQAAEPRHRNSVVSEIKDLLWVAGIQDWHSQVGQ